jgi:hypothetical protein
MPPSRLSWTQLSWIVTCPPVVTLSPLSAAREISESAMMIASAGEGPPASRSMLTASPFVGPRMMQRSTRLRCAPAPPTTIASSAMSGGVFSLPRSSRPRRTLSLPVMRSTDLAHLPTFTTTAPGSPRRSSASTTIREPEKQ